MKSNYKRLGDYIRQVNIKNEDGKVDLLVGVNMKKEFILSSANIIGTDLTKYKIIKKNQFACVLMKIGRDGRLSASLLKEHEIAIISSAYYVFEVINENELLSEYLMMWLSRSENDRYLWFLSGADIRGSISWNDFCSIEINIPPINKQKEIVKEYETITNRILLNESLNQKLEDMAQTIYKQWFVNFEFPNAQGLPYKSNGGEMVYNSELDCEIPKGWEVASLSTIASIIMGQSPLGDTYNQNGDGEIFYQGRTEFDFRFPTVRIYTTAPNKMAKKGDILMSVRAPVGDINIANEKCCIGRGIASLSSKIDCNSFLYYLLKDIKKSFDVSNDGGTVFGSITKDELYDIKILKPNDDTVIKFNDCIKKIDKKIEFKCKEVNILKKLKEILLSKVITGKEPK